MKIIECWNPTMSDNRYYVNYRMGAFLNFKNPTDKRVDSLEKRE